MSLGERWKSRKLDKKPEAAEPTDEMGVWQMSQKGPSLVSLIAKANEKRTFNIHNHTIKLELLLLDVLLVWTTSQG